MRRKKARRVMKSLGPCKMSQRMRQFLDGCARIASEQDQEFVRTCYRKAWLGKSLPKQHGDRLLRIWKGEHFLPADWLK
jgi:hypothetical protein